MKWINRIIVSLVLALFVACNNDKVQEVFVTENVVVIVVDGMRYSESWGDPSHANIPSMDSLRSKGVFFPNFFNDGLTRTVSGHTALLTGVYETLENNGNEYPTNPSFLQCWAEVHGDNAEDAWIITSKDKLEVLGNCVRSNWHDQFLPRTHCGIDGNGLLSGYQDDSATVVQGLEIMNTHHPKLTVFNLRDPDFTAHMGVWSDYLESLQRSDECVRQIVDFIDSDPVYAGKTTIFITSDHGRHLDGVSSGFASHGDECAGCRKIGMLAIGPDFTPGKVVEASYGQIDVPVTIARMLHFKMKYADGRSMKELFD